MSIGLVANIAVMLISFLAMLLFANTVLHWLGRMVDVQEFSFEVQYLFKLVSEYRCSIVVNVHQQLKLTFKNKIHYLEFYNITFVHTSSLHFFSLNISSF